MSVVSCRPVVCFRALFLAFLSASASPPSLCVCMHSPRRDAATGRKASAWIFLYKLNE